MVSPTSISGRVTTFNAPQYEGPLYNITPTDTPLLSMIGGLNGGDPVNSVVFNWQEFDLRSATQTSALEGADAPTGTGRARGNVFNVLQIIHETVDVSYTKLAASQQRADVGTAHPQVVATGLPVGVTSELDWQVEQRLKEIARDVEYTIINGTFQDASTITVARKTRGLLEAISSNIVDSSTAGASSITGSSSDDVIADTAHGLSNGDRIQFTAITGGTGISLNTTYFVINAATDTFQISASLGGSAVTFADFTGATWVEPGDLSSASADHLLALMQEVYENGGIMESDTAAVVANAWNKRQLTKKFVGTDAGYRQDSRTVGGVRVDTIMTDFGELSVVLDRHMPASQVMVTSLEQLRLKWLAQEKGTLFAEPLAKIGAKERVQIVGEWGLEYGNEKAHGKVTNLSTR